MVAIPLAVDVGETPPQVVEEQDTVQLTPLLVESFTSVAVRGVVALPSTIGAAGVTAIPTEGTVRFAEADLVASVAELPVTITVMLLAGGVAGAV